MEDKSSKRVSRNLLKRLDLKPVNKKAKKIEKATLRHAHTFVVSRFANLRSIRRHVVGWLFLISILIGFTGAQLSFVTLSTNKLQATGGGTYAEGTVDVINTLNPLFSTTQAELSSNKLIFSGLLKYDSQGLLQPDLAESWEVNKDNTEYTFVLREHLKWHDGKKVTANDVVTTVKAMQDPRVGALAQASWKAIKVKADGSRKIVFTLPNAYAPFASAATFAILPHHILAKITPEDLRESDFSKNPIGSGPFRFIDLKPVSITGGKSALQMEAFDKYWDESPQVSRFTLYTYSQPADLLKGLTAHEINAANDISLTDSKKLNQAEFKKYKIPLNSGVYALFKNDSELLKDVKVRRALVGGIDVADLRRELETNSLESPVVNNQLSLANQVKQTVFDPASAKKLLNESGWVKSAKSGYFEKNGMPLELRLVTVDAGDYRKITTFLREKWTELGVKINVQIVDPEQVQQSILRPRAYDILVYELELGGDADSYAYWHSSQINGAGLNFANYSSPISDDALTTARIRSTPQLRDAKYATFAKQWVSDAPALALYQPVLHYVNAHNVSSVKANDHLPTPSDRFSSVNQWTVQSKLTSQTP